MDSRLFALFLATLSFAVSPAAPEPHPVNLTGDLSHWAAEQMPGGSLTVRDGALDIQDAGAGGGSTIWLRRKITGPVEITYEATVVLAGGPNDRLSDLNCFWMAVDPRAPDKPPFAPAHARTGKFREYDTLFTYYVGHGGHNNSKTRFRRYNGISEPPLLPENDLSDKKFLLKSNHAYRIRLVARDGIAEYWRDGEKIFTFRDAAPLTGGWFAIRTVHSHLVIRNLQVTPLR